MKKIKKIKEIEIFKGEYLYWILFTFSFIFSARQLFGWRGLFYSIGLFGLIGIMLVNIKQVIFSVEDLIGKIK